MFANMVKYYHLACESGEDLKLGRNTNMFVTKAPPASQQGVIEGGHWTGVNIASRIIISAKAEE